MNGRSASTTTIFPDPAGQRSAPRLPHAGATATPSDLALVPRTDARRRGLEDFIATTFLRSYGARIQHYAEQLVGIRGPRDAWLAGVGFSPAGDEPLFLEQYLNGRVEDAIAQRLGVRVARTQVVEVGNLAAVSPGAARRLIVHMTGLLHRLGHTWVVFTATRALLNSFARLDVSPIVLAPADPRRLDASAEHWGRYYETRPQVMTASITLGFIQFLAERPHAGHS